MSVNKPMMNEPVLPPVGRKPGGPEGHPGTSRAGSRIALLVVIALVGGGIWWFLDHQRRSADPKGPGGPGAPGGPGGGRMEMPPVPVVAGTVQEKDVPIYLDGLGTVQAYNSVSIRARVDGQLKKVAFVEGQDVQTGDLLAQIDPDPYQAQLEQAAAKKGQDEAQLANAQIDLKRYRDLLATEAVTQQVFDTQKALVTQLEAAVKADEAAIQNARVSLAYTTIRSPLDGRTGLRLVDQGNIVHVNDTNGLVMITQLRPISVVFTLPEKNLGQIQEQAHGEPTNLTVLAVAPDETTILGEGRVAVLDNQIDTGSGTLKLKATFPNADLRLWPGLFVNARLLLTVRKNCAVVPASVIQRGPEGAYASYAFVINPDQTVTNRPVKVAQIEQGEALVEEGLRPGELVVVDGQYKLQRGSKVRIADGTGATGGGERGGRSGRGSATSEGRGGGSGARKGPAAEGGPGGKAMDRTAAPGTPPGSQGRGGQRPEKVTP